MNLPFKQIDTYRDNTFGDSISNKGDIKLIKFVPKITPFILDSIMNNSYESHAQLLEVISITLVSSYNCFRLRFIKDITDNTQTDP